MRVLDSLHRQGSGSGSFTGEMGNGKVNVQLHFRKLEKDC